VTNVDPCEAAPASGRKITAVTGKGQTGLPSEVYSAGEGGCCVGRGWPDTRLAAWFPRDRSKWRRAWPTGVGTRSRIS